MKFSTDHAQIKQWAPLVMEGRDPQQKVAATDAGGYRCQLRRNHSPADRQPEEK